MPLVNEARVYVSLVRYPQDERPQIEDSILAYRLVLPSTLVPQRKEVLHPIRHNRGPPPYSSQPILVAILGAPIVQLSRVDILAGKLPCALRLPLPSLKKVGRYNDVLVSADVWSMSCAISRLTIRFFVKTLTGNCFDQDRRGVSGWKTQHCCTTKNKGPCGVLCLLPSTHL